MEPVPALRHAPPSPPRFGGYRPSAIVAGTVLVLLTLVLGVLPVPGAAVPFTSGSSRLLPAVNPLATCNVPSTATPSAVLIPLAVPSHNLTANGNFTAGYEVEIAGYNNTTQSGTRIYVPNLWFKFPLVGNTTYQIHMNATVLTFTQPGWSNVSLTQKTIRTPGGLAFLPGAMGTLTSQKLAVMGTAQYGNLTIELRWHWINTLAGGVVKQGPWSVPTNQSTYPKGLPTIFFPAPYVYILNFNGTAVIGTNYTANLAGMVEGQRFFLEMEYPGSGHVVEAQGETAPLNVSNYTVGIKVLNYVHELTPGTYLVHIHDNCGAMLWSKSVKAVYAPNASIGFVFSPGVCGPIKFNATAQFTNGTVGVFQPSPNTYNFSLAYCKGHSFTGWSTTGGLHIASGHSIVVSASGTFTIYYT